MSSPAIGGPIRVALELRSFATELVLPPGTEVLRTSQPPPLPSVREAVAEALAHPIGTAPLAEICRGRFAAGEELTGGRAPHVVIVVSDNTRPVPYQGEDGILWPLVRCLLETGILPQSITLLVATGTHRVLSDEEMWRLFDERARLAGVKVSCHDASDRQGLVHIGRSTRGAEVWVNRIYMEAGLRILTGLVEPHLMAGVSGGRKSICPGLLDVESVQQFHGPVTLAHENATDLVLEGNPCHEISLEIARMAGGADFVLNVTMRQDGRVAGVFAGDMEEAHLAAVEHMRAFAQVDLTREYDVVVIHGGPVGVNHYQVQKAAAVGTKAVRRGGHLIVVADTTDPDPVGTESYRRMMELLGEIGPAAFVRTIMAEDWEFVHDQWGAQVWAKVMGRIPEEHIYYFSPQTSVRDYALLPGVSPVSVLSDDPTGGTAHLRLRSEVCLGGPGERVTDFVSRATQKACKESEKTLGRKPAVACLADGPHGIPAIDT